MSLNFKSKWTPLFLSNFLGVFNDNLLKNAVIFIAVVWSHPTWMTQSQLVSIVSGSLVIPYVFLSPAGGMLAVRYSKLKIFRLFKLLELPIMAVACISFYFQWIGLAIFSVLLMGSQSALYSPSKYSLIRDIGGEEGVSFGSGIFEMMAFIGILTGTVTASFISDRYYFGVISAFFLAFALMGYLVTKQIRANELPPEQETDNTLNPVKFILNSYRFAKRNGLVNSSVFGASAFWLIGSILQMNIVVHTKSVHNMSNSVTGINMAVAAVGIALGCWAAGKLQGKKVIPGLILVGLSGMILTFLILTFIKTGVVVYAILVFLAAFFGGLFQIPNLSMLQNSHLARKLGDMIAYLNLVTFVFILGGAVLFSSIMYSFHDNSYVIFGLLLLLCVLIGIYFLRKSRIFLDSMFEFFKFRK